MSEQERLRKALKRQFATKQNLIEARPGQMGDGYGAIEVPGRQHYFYVRVAGMVEEVFNNRVPAENDLLVTVGFDPAQPNLYQVLSTRTATPGGATGGAITGYAPAIRYEWMANGGGQDPLYMQLRAFLPLRVGTYSGMLIQVYRGVVWTGTSFAEINTQTLDLTSHIPSTSGKCALVLITINESAEIVATKGAEVNIVDLGLDDIPAIPAGTREVLGAVRVYNGQTAVQEARTNTDIIDLRFTWSADGGGTYTLEDHDHSGDAGDGGSFFLTNLSSGTATVGQVATADGSGGVVWSNPASTITLAEYGGNPIIEQGAGGSWEDVDVANPDVFWDTPNNRWVMNYSGFDGSVWKTGLAYSTDLINWTKEVANPVFAPDGTEGYIAANGSIVYLDGVYYLFYQVTKSGASKICAASSTNLLTWTRLNSGNPVIDIGTAGQWDESGAHDPAARLMEDGATIEIFYAGHDSGGHYAIGRATSTDGVTFTKTGKLIDSEGIAIDFGEPFPLRPTGQHYEIWTDHATVSGYRNIGRFTTDDGGTTWEFQGDILTSSGSGWNSAQVFDNCTVVHDGILYVYHGGATIAGEGEGLDIQIGVATTALSGYYPDSQPTAAPTATVTFPELLVDEDGEILHDDDNDLLYED